MTLVQVVNTIKNIAIKQPIVNATYEGSVYDINGDPSTKYANVIITQQEHTEYENYMAYNFVIFYVDRLVDDLEDNRLQVQSIGIQVISNILRTLEEEYDWVVDNKTYSVFTQRFQDLCSGVYCAVRLEVPIDDICAEYYDEEDE